MSTYDEILAAARDSEPAEMDLSYLDSFRKDGAAGLREHRQHNGHGEHAGDEVALNRQAEMESAPGLELDEDLDDLAMLDEPEPEPEPDRDRDRDRDRDGAGRDDSPHEKAGSSGAGSSGTAIVINGGSAGPGETALVSGAPLEETADAHAEASTAHLAEQAGPDGDLVAPIPLRLTDHQEAVQAAARSGNGGNDSGDDVDAAGIPRRGFNLLGAGSQPNIKALPEVVVDALRAQVVSILVDQGVAEAAAKTSVKQMGQNTLVMAFLIAQLDVRVDVDAKTATVAALFRHKNPLLGALMERMTALELTAQRQLNETAKAAKEIATVKQTSAVLEQAAAYSIADRTENLARGLKHVDDIDLVHASALRARDRLREETKKQLRIEREREGRSGTY